MTTTCSKTLREPVLPSLPTVILRLLEATDDEKKSVKELADIASKDPALCTQILKIANSALVSPRQPVKTITQAALNLGISTMRNVAITAAVCQTFSKIEVPKSFSLSNFWNHSLSCALLCKTIASYFHSPFSEEEAFLAGLLHDIGQLSLIIKNPHVVDKIVQNPRTGQTILESEEKIWGIDHTKEGFKLLEKWHLPLTIRSAVKFHHEEIAQIAGSIPILKVVYLADICAHFLYKENSLSTADLLDLFKRVGLPIEADGLEQIFKDVQNSIKQTANELGLTIGDHKTPKLPQGKETFELLEHRAFDLATLIGTLESLLLVKTRQELHSVLFTSLANLFEIQSGILFHYSNRCLKGVFAKGTEDDSLAPQLHIIDLEDSIWSEAYKQGKPVFSRDFFKDKRCKTIDTQLKDYLGSDFIAVPLIAGNDKVGALALAVSESQWIDFQQKLSLIRLLAREVAHVLRGISYRQLWEKEHVLNELLVKKCPIGIVITDEDGQIIFVNKASQNLLGLDSKVLIEKDIWELLQVPFSSVADELRRSGKIKNIGRRKICTLDGNVRWLEIQQTSLFLGGSTKLLFFIRDVTDSVALESERKQRALWLEKELNKRTQELKKAQEQLIQSERMGAASEIARKVVHEVNNPLGIIKNLLKILKIQKEKGNIEDKTIDAIGSEIDRVARIVRKLSDFSKQKGESCKKADKPKTDINEVFSEIKLLVGPGLAEKNIKLRLEMDNALPSVAISKDELKQILINLFKNSEEALQGEGEIIIRAHYRDGNVIIEFEDTGPGVPDNLKDRIFSPFVTTKGEENSGLGLSVCYGLLKACGGDISLTNKEGVGALFTIRIPAASRND